MSVAVVVERARALEGASIAEIARSVGAEAPGGGASTKGRAGEIVERALGADARPGARAVDFPALGLELKTVPVDRHMRPHESTFVCVVDLGLDVDWAESWARTKLARVLFIPIVGEKKSVLSERRVGRAVLWEPTNAQEEQLRSDYDDIMGLVGSGRVEDVSAHLGRYMQMRPKAKDGSARTVVAGREGERIPTVPRGFYLRASFTAAILADPCALP